MQVGDGLDVGRWFVVVGGTIFDAAAESVVVDEHRVWVRLGLSLIAVAGVCERRESENIVHHVLGCRRQAKETLDVRFRSHCGRRPTRHFSLKY